MDIVEFLKSNWYYIVIAIIVIIIALYIFRPKTFKFSNSIPLKPPPVITHEEKASAIPVIAKARGNVVTINN